MDARLAGLSRTIDAAELGRRIRNARVAAGMTQSQVAGGEVTAAYLSRIEDGQRRPEAGLLERMAERMGTTLETLLVDVSTDRARELQLKLDFAELSLASGNPGEALEGSRAVLDELVDSPVIGLKLPALRVQAGALEVSGDLAGAIAVLEEITAEPSPDAQWVRSLIALSRCYRDSGQFAKAVEVGENASGVIEEFGLAGLTESIQLTVTVSAAYQRMGDLETARATCERALRAADKYDSPIAKASAYWNAAAIETAANGATRGALEMTSKALALFELSEDNRNLAKLRAQVATLQLAQDPPDAAAALETLANADAELTWSGASAWEVALLHITRGRAHHCVGDNEAALRDIEKGLEIAPDEAPFLTATAASVRGQIAASEGRIDEARSHYRQAIHLLSAAGSDREVAQLWFSLAHHLAEVGDTDGALEAFRSAGVSTGLRPQVGSATPVRSAS